MKLYNVQKMKEELAIIGIIAFLLLILYALGFHWFCPFFDGLGFSCPGCGFTSAIIAALKLNFTDAFFHHPLFLIGFIFPIYYGYANFLIPKKPKSYKIVIGIIISLFIVIYVLRIFNVLPNTAELGFNPDSVFMKLLNALNI